MIVRWPGKIKPDTTSSYLVMLTDLFATAAEIVDVELPDNAAEDSFSMLSVLKGAEPSHDREIIFVQGDPKDNAIAVCTGRWKLIDWKRGNDKDGKPEQMYALYDLESDPGEKTDVSESHPEKVEQLRSALVTARESGRTRP